MIDFDIKALKRAAELELTRRDLLKFTTHTKPDYIVNWHHALLTRKIQDWYEGKSDKKKLMIFLPPQTGKSEIVSRRVPAWILGDSPNTKIALTSYSATKAEEFSIDVQRIMNSDEYKELFPAVRLPDIGMSNKAKKKSTNEFFEILDTPDRANTGFLKAVGITGPLTGTPVDIAIIDDPIKDDIEADSEKMRERAWNWYCKVLETRLHNDSKVLLTMTRWHEDDLAGRLLEAEPDEWDVIILPALKEKDGHPEDPREIGESIWPERHSREKYLKTKKKSARTFASLMQQRPSPEEGDIWLKEWFTIKKASEVPSMIKDMWIDGAYTEKTKNDPTGIDIMAFHRGNIYVWFSTDKHMEVPELLKLIPETALNHDIGRKSRTFIEPKASGLALKQILYKATRLNIVLIRGKWVQEGKVARAKAAAPTIEGGRVILIEGHWNEAFLDQVCTFPNAKHDEHVDNLSYAIYRYILWRRKKGLKKRN